MAVKLVDSSLAVTPLVDVTDHLQLFTIENKNGTKMTLCNFGATVVSIFVKDKDGNLGDVVLGYKNPADYLQDDYYIGSVVGRYANRINGGKVTIDTMPYQLHMKEGGYHLHGGAEGFNKKIFAAFPFRNKNNTGVCFKYTSPHLEEGFPGEFNLEVIYTLNEKDAWTIEYKGISDRTTLVNLTQHTYFNLSGNPSTIINAHEIKIMAQYYLPVDNLQVPTGEIAAVSNTPFNFTTFKKIGQDIFEDNEQLKLSNGYDHSFVLEEKHTAGLKHAAIVKEPITGRKMDVYTTEPSVHFYTGNFLNNVKGKNNITYNGRSGFCIETQHFPDTPNHLHFPSTILKASEQFYSKTIYKFSI